MGWGTHTQWDGEAFTPFPYSYRGRGSLQGASGIPELHMATSSSPPFSPLDLFPKMFCSYPPISLPSCTSPSFSAAPDVFPVPAACLVSCTQIVLPQNQSEGAIGGGGFQQNAYCSFLGFCQDGFRYSCSSLEAPSRARAKQTPQRPAHWGSVWAGLSDHVCHSLLGGLYPQGMCVHGLCNHQESSPGSPEVCCVPEVSWRMVKTQ